MAARKRIALVTGGGTGVGKAAAVALARDGFTVVVTGRRKEPLDAVVKEIGRKGGQAMAVVCDVADEAQVAALFATIRKAHRRLDVVFNNAGVNTPGVPLEDLTFENWKKVVDVNLSGMFLVIRESFRQMKAQKPMGGRIINNGSISAHAPRPNSIAYTATKHAVTGLTRTASLDGRKYDIAVGQIDIGNAFTEMAARMTKGVPQANGEIAIEAVMDASNVGNAVAHMASLPLDANVLFLTVMASKMPFVGRG